MEDFNLDARQLARIEPVHRCFHYQRLYAAACLFKAAASGVTHVVVEKDGSAPADPLWWIEENGCAAFSE